MAVPQVSMLDDDLILELGAMQTIARTLELLHDPEMRRRVLRWTNERFDGVAAAAPEQTAARADRADPTLTVDALELFPDDAPTETHRADAGLAAAADAPLDSLVRGFATDLQRFAIQWQSV